eukprot:531145-Amphidinium_carterae.1
MPSKETYPSYILQEAPADLHYDEGMGLKLGNIGCLVFAHCCCPRSSVVIVVVRRSSSVGHRGSTRWSVGRSVVVHTLS